MSRAKAALVERVEGVITKELVAAALLARERAYAPYSKYKVGAAILTRKGEVFIGCNVENAAYGPTNCAERTAIFSMVAAGARSPIACVVTTGGPEPGFPCGVCRQVLAEFAYDMPIACIAKVGRKLSRRDTTLAALLPEAFRFLPPPK